MSSALPVSDEAFARTADGVELCYQTFGSPDGDPLLLVMGLGGPMTWWDPEFCLTLAERGFFVIRYDNRDTGRSTKLRDHRVPKGAIVRAFLGRPVDAPYSLSTMADDAVALLDELDIPAAHVAGISMGGMIVQTLALEHPDRILSMTSIMSTTGRRTVGFQHPTLLPALIAPRSGGRDQYVKNSASFWNKISSPDYPEPLESVLERAEVTWDRGFTPGGVLRHMLAVLTQPDRTERLADVRVPTAVVHGLKDKMVHVSGGRATAAALPGAELSLVPGMGHDIPAALHSMIASVIRRTADRA